MPEAVIAISGGKLAIFGSRFGFGGPVIQDYTPFVDEAVAVAEARKKLAEQGYECDPELCRPCITRMTYSERRVGVGDMLPESGSRQDFKKATHAELARYGVWDAIDRCWMGNNKGPLVYEDEMMARAAATIINQQFRTGHRYRKKVFWEDRVVLKDEVTPKMTAEQAISEIERRA